jgi:TolB-like protein/lipoprotein NlpI
LSLFNELKRRNVLRVAAAYVVAAWLLIQVAETIFPLFGFDDAPARILVIVLTIGFIPALIFAWAFEMTPEGLKKESEVDRSQSMTPQTGKQLDRMIMVVLALALGYFAFDKFVLNPQREAAQQQQQAEQLEIVAEQSRQAGRTEALVGSYGDKSIAVLAFDDMSQDKDQEYLSDGIAEELLNLLAGIPELRVISRSSAFSFKGQNVEIPKIALRLNVANILEGSVRTAGNKVRITAQLIEARTDTHLWSKTYDRQLDDIFAIQDEIAAAVVEELKVTLLGAPQKVRKTDSEAYALYLQARHLGRLGSAEGYTRCIELYQQALAIDPNFTNALDGLATEYFNQAARGMRPAEEGFLMAQELVERALEIDPDFAHAHATLGSIYSTRDRNLELAAMHQARALELDPGDSNMIGYGASMMMDLGRMDEAVTLSEFVVARDPVNPVSYYNLGVFSLYAGRIEESIEIARTVLGLSPDFIGGYYSLSMAQLLGGSPQAALESAQKETYEPLRLLALIAALHALGQDADSDAALTKMVEKHGHEWPYNIAYVVAFRGQVDSAFEWLEKAIEIDDTGLAEAHVQPLFANLHGEPRWLPFLESIGKSPAQLAAIPFEVTLPQ